MASNEGGDVWDALGKSSLAGELEKRLTNCREIRNECYRHGIITRDQREELTSTETNYGSSKHNGRMLEFLEGTGDEGFSKFVDIIAMWPGKYTSLVSRLRKFAQKVSQPPSSTAGQ